MTTRKAVFKNARTGRPSPQVVDCEKLLGPLEAVKQYVEFYRNMVATNGFVGAVDAAWEGRKEGSIFTLQMYHRGEPVTEVEFGAADSYEEYEIGEGFVEPTFSAVRDATPDAYYWSHRVVLNSGSLEVELEDLNSSCGLILTNYKAGDSLDLDVVVVKGHQRASASVLVTFTEDYE
jgi:hypothetical protein